VPGRAKRGASGFLNPQSAPAGPNTVRGAGFFGAWARKRSVDGQVPRTGSLRTASGPEGSSAKEFLSGAAVRPGPSKRLGFLPGRPSRRRLRGRALGFGRGHRPSLRDRRARAQGRPLAGHSVIPGPRRRLVGVGVTRLQIPSGGWSTPAHDHGVEEELFYVLGGRGLAWHKGETFEIGEGDCILFLPAVATTRCTRSPTSTSSRSARASTTRARASRGWALRSSASATSRASTVPPTASDPRGRRDAAPRRRGDFCPPRSRRLPAARRRRCAHVPRRRRGAHVPRLRNARAGCLCFYPASNRIAVAGASCGSNRSTTGTARTEAGPILLESTQ
jgi:mannose-6-phosphate isomerase-like protein (cupin superfamily)